MAKVSDNVLENLLSGMEERLNKEKVNPIQPKTHVDKKLHDFFLSLHSPTHPPYASMIRMAIVQLSEEGGSSEEAISDYIKKEYKGLPWGHDSYLSHYLGKLCGNLDLVKSNDGRYMLPIKDGDSGNIRKRGRKRRRCKGRWGKDKDRNESEELSKVVEDVFQESSDSERQQFEVAENVEASGEPENAEEFRREHKKLKAEQIKVSDEQHNVEMQLTEATEQQIEGNYDHSLFVMERRKECLNEDHRQQNCVDGKEIEEEKQQPHELEDELVGGQGLIEEQQNDARDKTLTSCCDGEGDDGVNLRVQSEESFLLVIEAEEHDFSKQEDQLPRSPAQVQHPESSGAERPDQSHCELPRPKRRGRGRPPKLKRNADMIVEQDFSKQEDQPSRIPVQVQHPGSSGTERSAQGHCEQQRPKRRGRGRPPKLKPHADMNVDTLLLPDKKYDKEAWQQQEVQGSEACPKSNAEADSIMVPSTQTASDRNDDEQPQKQPQQPLVRRRGRPPKLKVKEATATKLDASSGTSCPEQQQQQAPRRRGRPPKVLKSCTLVPETS